MKIESNLLATSVVSIRCCLSRFPSALLLLHGFQQLPRRRERERERVKCSGCAFFINSFIVISHYFMKRCLKKNKGRWKINRDKEKCA